MLEKLVLEKFLLDRSLKIGFIPVEEALLLMQ
mgnify:CR=1 FL=1